MWKSLWVHFVKDRRQFITHSFSRLMLQYFTITVTTGCSHYARNPIQLAGSIPIFQIISLLSFDFNNKFAHPTSLSAFYPFLSLLLWKLHSEILYYIERMQSRQMQDWVFDVVDYSKGTFFFALKPYGLCFLERMRSNRR